jgi:predicted ATP-grasp superfamily ATP-dependent carboligase
MNDYSPPCRLGAVLIGGDYRALGTVRSLGRRGIPVCVITDEHLLAGLSRYVRYRFKWPATDQLAFLAGLADRGLAGWTIFPSGDESAAFVSQNHCSLSRHFVLTTPPWPAFQWLYNKRLTNQLASDAGVPCPATLYPSNRNDLETLECPFPILLKPSRKHQPSRFTRDKAWLVNNRSELLARYDEACTLIRADSIMLQDLIPGDGGRQFSFAALCEKGEPLASLVAIRWRQHPIDFGQSSSFVETVEEPDVERLAGIVLRRLRFTGLVEVEFKYDPRDNQFKLLDINPRIWGWHTLGAAAGLDFSYLAWQLANGHRIPRTRGRPGVKWMRAVTDALALLQQWRAGCFSLRQYLVSLRPPLEHAIWALDDPLPALSEIPTLIYARYRIRRSIQRPPIIPSLTRTSPASAKEATFRRSQIRS